MTRLVRERLYDGACLLVSSRAGGVQGDYQEPSQELAFAAFAGSLLGRLLGYKRTPPGK